MDTASACLEFSEGDSVSWSFTKHLHSADNDYVVQQELSFHSIIFVALSTGSGQMFHYSLFTVFSFQIPQNSFSLSCFSIMFIKHMWVVKYFRLAHIGIFSLKRWIKHQDKHALVQVTYRPQGIPILPWCTASSFDFCVPPGFSHHFNFLFLCPCGVFCLCLNTFSQRHQYHCW